MRPIFIILGGGLLLWYLDSNGYLSGLSSLFGGTTATPTPVTTPPATGGTASGPTAATLASLYQLMIQNAGSAAQVSGLTPDGWGYSLNAVGVPFGVAAPDPTALFNDRTIVISAPTYWSAVSPTLKAQYGLSGMGAVDYRKWMV
jgi:hypothetical protein